MFFFPYHSNQFEYKIMIIPTKAPDLPLLFHYHSSLYQLLTSLGRFELKQPFPIISSRKEKLAP